MKVLVTGANGMLGSAVTRQFAALGHTVTAITRKDYDIALLEPIAKLPLHGHDAIINCAGIINRRTEIVSPETSYIVNSMFPRMLADEAEKLDIPFIHISTDCVFDGKKGLADETTPMSAHTLYGRSKYFGEPTNAMVLRTSIIGPEQQNYYSLLCWFLSQQETCKGYTNHLWNGLTTLELAGALHIIFEKNLWQPVLRHVHGEDISKHALLNKIAAAFHKNIAVEAAAPEPAHDMRLRTKHTDFLAALAIRTLDAQLADTAKHCTTTGQWKTHE